MEKVNLRTAGITQLTPQLLVIDCENEKVVFAHLMNIGYITPDGIFYVKKEFYDGGGKNTVFMQQFRKIIIDTYKLKGDITEERVWAVQDSVKRMKQINEALLTEKDPVKAKSMLDAAKQIFSEFNNDTNKVLFGQINEKVSAILNPEKPHVFHQPVIETKKPVVSAPEVVSPEKRLAEIKAAVKDAKTKKAKKALLAEAESLLEKADTGENRKLVATIKRAVK